MYKRIFFNFVHINGQYSCIQILCILMDNINGQYSCTQTHTWTTHTHLYIYIYIYIYIYMIANVNNEARDKKIID